MWLVATGSLARPCTCGCGPTRPRGCGGWSPKTAKTTADNFRLYILPAIGRRRVDRVTAVLLDDLYASLEARGCRRPSSSGATASSGRCSTGPSGRSWWRSTGRSPPTRRRPSRGRSGFPRWPRSGGSRRSPPRISPPTSSWPPQPGPARTRFVPRMLEAHPRWGWRRHRKCGSPWPAPPRSPGHRARRRSSALLHQEQAARRGLPPVGIRVDHQVRRVPDRTTTASARRPKRPSASRVPRSTTRPPPASSTAAAAMAWVREDAWGLPLRAKTGIGTGLLTPTPGRPHRSRAGRALRRDRARSR